MSRGRVLCCIIGRDSTIYIYVCSSTLIYLLFTESIHTVHPQSSMIQLVAQSQTVRDTLWPEKQVDGSDIQCVLKRGGN